MEKHHKNFRALRACPSPSSIIHMETPPPPLAKILHTPMHQANYYGPYGGPVGRGCHDVHNLRTCTRHAHLGFCGLAHTRFADVHTCTSGICGFAHTQFADVHTCISGICGLAHTRFAEVQLFPRGCHVVTTCSPRGYHNCTSANRVCASPHVCTPANRVCASSCVQVRKSQMCMCTRHDSRDLPGHRIQLPASHQMPSAHKHTYPSHQMPSAHKHTYPSHQMPSAAHKHTYQWRPGYFMAGGAHMRTVPPPPPPLVSYPQTRGVVNE